MGKLLQVVGTIMINLYYRGFCLSEEQEGAEEGGMQFMDGTGVGEGHGENNVSDQIEYEEQLLGEKGEQEQE